MGNNVNSSFQLDGPEGGGVAVDIWLVRLDDPGFVVNDLKRLLIDDETRQSQRFSTSELVRRFIVRRAVRRKLLSRYCRTEPQELHFDLGIHGKPTISPRQSAEHIHFNASTSGGVELLAVAADDVGIDIEQIKPLPDLDALIKQTTNDHDRQLLEVREPDSRLRSFYRQWTCKEAVLKATGLGLSLPPREISAGAASASYGSTGVVSVKGESWFVSCFEPAPGFSAAMATRQPTAAVNFRWCSPDVLTS